MRSDHERIEDILEAADKIRIRLVDSFEEFYTDEMLQVWVIHHLQVIGEAARGISQEFRERHPDVPWRKTIALRNILVHEYFGIDMGQVWMMSQEDLPQLQRQIKAIREHGLG